MTKEQIISGLKFTEEMFLFDPSTGEKFTEPRNYMDKTTIDACRGAIKLLKQMPPKGHWIMKNNFIAGEYRPYAYMCSECGFKIEVCRGLSQDKGHNLFCQHCGADMR